MREFHELHVSGNQTGVDAVSIIEMIDGVMNKCADLHRVVLNHPQISGVGSGMVPAQEFADRTDDQTERCFELVGDILEEGFLLAGLLHQFILTDPLSFQIPAHSKESDESVDEHAGKQQIDGQHGNGKVPGPPDTESDEFRAFCGKVRIREDRNDIFPRRYGRQDQFVAEDRPVPR